MIRGKCGGLEKKLRERERERDGMITAMNVDVLGVVLPNLNLLLGEMGKTSRVRELGRS